MKTLRHPSLQAPVRIPTDDPTVDRHELVALYWHHHPRFRFLKLAPTDACLLDIGAGSGGLALWREWQAPARHDIEMHGCDLRPATHADRYAAFHVMDIDGTRFPYDAATFDVAFSSHVIEHLHDTAGFAREVHRVLKPGGTVYIETPTDASCDFPPRTYFHSEGLPTTTTNFFDDHTHTRALGRDALADIFLEQGFTWRERGDIRLPFLEGPLLAKAAALQDEELGSYGLWSALGFAHYGIFVRV
jgi:SAM-dependent methyltransferase